MKVHIIFGVYNYDGDDIIAIYAQGSKKKAKARLEEERAKLKMEQYTYDSIVMDTIEVIE